ARRHDRGQRQGGVPGTRRAGHRGRGRPAGGRLLDVGGTDHADPRRRTGLRLVNRTMVVVALLSGVGATLVLSELRWFTRRPLDDRVLPYVPGGWHRSHRQGLLSVETFRDVVRPLANSVGGLLGQVFGVREDLAKRLTRFHSPLDAT